MAVEKEILAHLATQFRRAQVILFTGAGFSSKAKNIGGEPLPTGAELRRDLWNLCFPGERLDESSSTQDLFEYALARKKGDLPDLLRRTLTVDSSNLPSEYGLWFSLPWYRVYTLTRVIGVQSARDVYSGVESLLHWDYHYWLQRGGLELEAGDIRLAENFLGQAFSLGGDDPLVRTEYGYLLIRLGVESPSSTDAGTRVGDGMAMLEEMIRLRGRYDQYPYHVLGSQGLAWSRRATLPARERRMLLERLIRHVDEGRSYHPKVSELKQLQEDLKRELLMMAVDVRDGKPKH